TSLFSHSRLIRRSLYSAAFVRRTNSLTASILVSMIWVRIINNPPFPVFQIMDPFFNPIIVAKPHFLNKRKNYDFSPKTAQSPAFLSNKRDSAEIVYKKTDIFPVCQRKEFLSMNVSMITLG